MVRMNPFELTRHGEYPADDIYAVAGQIVDLIKKEGLIADADVTKIGSAIMGYVDRRSTVPAHKMGVPRRARMYIPDRWTAADEQIWREWIGHHFTLEDWHRKVMYPVFGTNQQIWEQECDGWRDEIFAFLPWWIQRDWSVMDTVDPRQLPSHEEVQEAERAEAVRRKQLGIRVREVDPYLAEQEERRGKGRY
jgi:hypothetical protein